MRPPPLAALPRRRLDELAFAVPSAVVHGHAVTVTGMTQDSRALRGGDLFAAVPGARIHGAEHAGAAVDTGAVAVVTDDAGRLRAAATGVPVLVVPDVTEALGTLAAALHGHPSRDVPVVGVTGTDGKTTTSWLVAAALEASGVATGMIGSLDTRLGDQVLVAAAPQHRRTTPEAPDLQATLALLRERGAGAVVMEASSHGLALRRTAGTRFAVGVFTNLSHEHLDFHGDLEAYFQAKAMLFEACEHAVVTVNDEHGARLAAALQRSGRPVTTVSTTGAPASWRAVKVRPHRCGTTFTARGPGGAAVPVDLTLSGAFNVTNALGALAAAVALGAPATEAARGLATLAAVPGRMEWVGDDEVAALVDYAHTPGALRALLGAARTAAAAQGWVALVLGIGGGRDASKRPLISAAAGAGADVVVVTDDNPRDEDPAALRAELRAGIEGAPGFDRSQLHEVPDRDGAVELAMALARPGNVVVAAGKGPDRVQLVGGTTVPVDEPAALRRALARRRWPAAS